MPKKQVRAQRLALLLLALSVPWTAKVQTTNIFTIQTQAERGDANAEFNLGEAYYYGKDVPQDYAKAAGWYEKAALQKNIEAEYALGYMQRYGQGVPQNYMLAFSWLAMAAVSGHASAQAEIAKIYEFGLGVDQNPVQAFAWFMKSARQGNAEAEFNVGQMCQTGSGAPQNFVRAIYWYRRAANQGFPAAMWNLGDMYVAGNGPRNFAEGYFWLNIALSVEWKDIGSQDRATLADERDQTASHLSPALLLKTQERAQRWVETHPVVQAGSE
jgi:hypothetical protein